MPVYSSLREKIPVPGNYFFDSFEMNRFERPANNMKIE